MTKSELITLVAEKGEFSKKDAEKAINAVTGAITDALICGEKVQLIGFGTFEVREHAEKKGINPKNKQPITIPAKKAPAFKAGKTLKDAVN